MTSLRVRPRPRVPRRSSTSSRRTACSSTASSSTGHGKTLQDDQPGHRGGAGRDRRGRTPPTSTPPSGPPAGPTTRVWSRMPGRERAKYLYRIARIIQERSPRARRAGVARQRQADQGVARRRRPDRRRALLLLRRLGRQAGVRRLRPDPRRSASPARSSRGTSRC